MTDAEFKAKLIKRLRSCLQLADRDCPDDQLIRFTTGTLLYYRLLVSIKWADFKLNLARSLSWDSYYKREYFRYQRLYNTLLAENACYRRRNAALRGKLTEMRHERHVKHQNESSGH